MRFRAKFPAILLLVIAGIAILGWVVMVLWNLVVPSVFSAGHAIDYRHALGLLVLCRILFGGFHGRGGHRHHRWRRWAALTAEEQAQLMKERPSHCAWR
jgi:hypothetical protein